jgi:hypothetical protein
MNKQILILMAAGCAAVTASAQVVVDAWHYDGIAYDTDISSGISTGNPGGVAWGDKHWGVISNEMQRWSADYSQNKDAFIAKSSSAYDGVTGGSFQLEWDYVYADFANTELQVVGNGNTQLGMRRASDKADCAVQIKYIGDDVEIVNGVTNLTAFLNEFRLEVKDSHTGGSFSNVATFAGNTISNIHIREEIDLENAGTFGSHKVYYSHEGGPEVAVWTGTVWSAFINDDLRLGLSGNKGAKWALGDVVLLDNIVFTKLADPPPPPKAKGVIEEWLFDDANGSLFTGMSNSAPDPFGLGAWSGDKDWAFVSNGVLWAGAGASDTDNLYKNSTLSNFRPPDAPTNNIYELSWSVEEVNWTGITNNGAAARFGLRSSSNKDAFLVGISKNNDKIRLDMRVASETTALKFFGTNELYDATDIRVLADYDVGTFDVLYTVEGGIEKTATNNVPMDPLGTNDIGAVRMAIVTATNGWASSDYIMIDDLRLELYNPDKDTAIGKYNIWLSDYSVGTETNLTDNPDGDAYDNLYEYAFDGDPSVAGDLGYEPTYGSVEAGGTNYIEYIYTRRKDDAVRGLGYSLELNANLVIGTWTNDASKYTVVGAVDVVGGQWREITNHVETADDQLFIRTAVEFTE